MRMMMMRLRAHDDDCVRMMMMRFAPVRQLWTCVFIMIPIIISWFFLGDVLQLIGAGDSSAPSAPSPPTHAHARTRTRTRTRTHTIPPDADAVPGSLRPRAY